MRLSRLLVPTLREMPAEAEVVSHKLMLKAALIRKVAAGVYSFLPMGLKVLHKIEKIVREEMDRSGAQEVLLPALNPAELWKESGRWDYYGKELMRLKDRSDREFCLGPTHEEVITDLVRREVKSYRQLPLNFYQIQTKFRDELRPRFGVMRGREFLMKDAYSFDRDEEGAAKSYQIMYDTYCRIFHRCGLGFRAVEADTGPIGGSFSHEFMVLAETGEDSIAVCDNCHYASNVEKAETVVLKNEIGQEKEILRPIQKVSTPGAHTVTEVCRFLSCQPSQLVKTILYAVPDGVVVALIRGDHQVNEIKLKNLLGVSWLILADEKTILETTGGPEGFSGPIGLKKKVEIIADNELNELTNVVVGANEDNTHFINANLHRDFTPTRFADIRMIQANDPCPKCFSKIALVKGIEVGHIFKLGTKYSKAFGAKYLDEQSKERFCVMGCYGIGVSRIMAAAIEQNHDEDGIIWPLPIAPFSVLILPVNIKDSRVESFASEIYTLLENKGYEVLYDDRDERPGVKFKDADLLGIPYQVVIGSKSLIENMIEIRDRRTRKTVKVKKEETVETLTQMGLNLAFC
ncbi:MAG: proline--tRNA ligase [Candidatus Tectomicrobia bacterium]|uniref:Proline--tRNA ligase n=1 Tax=Tectimicrobiota bacterium TaxID=2528274 RepID=A0A933GJL1_UNCTE|nr:proline--tRNA ligase [Candidatus Tectomicrobia bacterium]